MALKFIDEIELKGKRVIARFDFNVPLDKDNSSKITDTTRIDMALETIQYLMDQGASKIILMSHLGRPNGRPDKKYSLEPVAKYLAEMLGVDVLLSESCKDRAIKNLLDLNSTKILLLQNLRFHPEEEANDREFARTLASYGDIFVNDAFGTAHRKHASTYEINAFFKNKAVGGLLLKKEIKALSYILEAPKAPFIGIVGGAKVSDKIKIIEQLLIKVTHLLIGGAMAYPFLKAQGHNIGTSLCSDEDVSLAKSILKSKSSSKIVLPTDHIVSDKFGGDPSNCPSIDISEEMMGLDIGDNTIGNYTSKIRDAKTILWNGPMGLFENPDFSKGTFAIAKALSDSRGYTLVGGGDSVSAVKSSGLSNSLDHVSTGGGASLEFIEKGSLPGIDALKFGIE